MFVVFFGSRLIEALEFALSIKKNTVAPKTYTDYSNGLSHFIEFLKKRGLDWAEIKDIEKKRVTTFLNEILSESTALIEIIQKRF